MIKCEICGREFELPKSFSSHLILHKITSKEYYDQYIKKEDEGKCLYCGKETNYRNFKYGYLKYCSKECKNNDIENIAKRREQTNLKKFGCINTFQNEDIKQRIKETCLNKYGVKSPIQNEEIKNKIKQTCLEKYGYEYALQNKDIYEKTKQTNLNRYGYESPIKNKEVQEKRKQTNLNRYGYEYGLQNEEVREKSRKTNLKKYGCENPMQNEEVLKKTKQTNLKKQLPKVYKILETLNLELLTEYKKSKNRIKLRCKKCNTIFYTTYDVILQGWRKCPTCFPLNKSNGENELIEFIKSIETSKIIENSRYIINPVELDIYIPDKNIAIEFDGLYWHCDENIENKYYHLIKTNECEKKNIRLIHIFEDEWFYKQDIVKNKLKNILNLNNGIQHIYARDCIIKEIDPKIKNEFLEKYHIQGKDTSIIKLGAFYNNELISVMTFSHGNISRKKYNDDTIWELSRFCSNYNYNVIGIASKLLTHFKRNCIWNEIYSYADRRWSQGNLYNVIGFELDNIIDPNYWYVKGLSRIHRFNLRKKYNEPNDISEWVLRENEGYHRIWDCGLYKYKMINVNKEIN